MLRSRQEFRACSIVLWQGYDARSGAEGGYQALEWIIYKQASVLSYMDVFLYLGLLFLICVPVILLVKRKKGVKIDLAEAMH